MRGVGVEEMKGSEKISFSKLYPCTYKARLNFWCTYIWPLSQTFHSTTLLIVFLYLFTSKFRRYIMQLLFRREPNCYYFSICWYFYCGVSTLLSFSLDVCWLVADFISSSIFLSFFSFIPHFLRWPVFYCYFVMAGFCVYVRLWVCVFMCVPMDVNTCIYIYINRNMHVQTYQHVCVCVSNCVFVFVCVLVLICLRWSRVLLILCWPFMIGLIFLCLYVVLYICLSLPIAYVVHRCISSL